MKSNNKVSIITLGCPKNLADSENLLEDLYKENFLYTEDLTEASIIIINTCGFIEDAKRESVEEILKMKHLKEKSRLVVFGCLAQRYKEELLREIPEIDAIFGVGEYEEIINYCKRVRDSKIIGLGYENPNGTLRFPHLRAPLYSSSYAYIKIAEGCNRGCSFCVIPSIRGKYTSFYPEDILRNVEKYLSLGVKELILVAQDITSYGKELGGYDLSSLLRDIASIRGDFWIRLLYLYPTSIDDRLIRTISGEDKICKYLDIPLQHSGERILKAMGRVGGRDAYKDLINKIREAIPGVTLRTTIMVGFPGETEEEFNGLKGFIEEMEFDRLGVFTYSKEEGTRASRLRGHLPKKIKERRRDEIMSLQAQISLKKNLRTLGHTYRALVDEIDGDLIIARLSFQAPEIDGVVIIEDNGELMIREGDFIDVRITEAFDYDLKGEIIRS